MTEQLEFHPIANCWPLIEGKDFTDLVEDIRANGLLLPVMLYEGMILDGRNRYRACMAADVEPAFTEFRGNDPIGFVKSMNDMRRHLTESQRAMVAAKLETLKQGRPSGKDANLHVFREDAAEKMNVSPRSVASAATVRDSGVPELVKAVERGEIKVSAAEQLVRSVPEDELAEAAKEGLEALKQKSAEIKQFRASLPTKKEAEKQAREIGGVVLAKDGKFHSGSSDEEKQQFTLYLKATGVLYAIRDLEGSPEEIAASVTPQGAETFDRALRAGIAKLTQILHAWESRDVEEVA